MVELTNPLIQIKKGALDFCVLAIIARRETYGYEIVKFLGEQGLATSEGTIYPLLARLNKDGLVTAAWRQEDGGNPRKYYRVTAKGETALVMFKQSWLDFIEAVNCILEGGVAHGTRT
ncbi:MAG: PadR family transcriptional regulator [Firmicutes bacterium]|nr:PadR family transcriptional regulator [Bacillota bacterium]